MVNLTDWTLTPAQKDVIKLELTFAPAPSKFPVTDTMAAVEDVTHLSTNWQEQHFWLAVDLQSSILKQQTKCGGSDMCLVHIHMDTLSNS